MVDLNNNGFFYMSWRMVDWNVKYLFYGEFNWEFFELMGDDVRLIFKYLDWCGGY